MFTSTSSPPPHAEPDSMSLKDGDCLDQPTFHARYEATEESFHAELIGGIVHVPSPARIPHARIHSLVDRWLGHYEEATPGVETLIAPTAILDAWSEPEPDVVLRIKPGWGGQSGAENEYIVGAPELMVEIAYSSVARESW